MTVPACDARPTAADGGAAALARNLGQARSVEVHVDDESIADALRVIAVREQTGREQTGRDIRVLVRAPGDANAARVVVGTPRSALVASLVASLADRAGIRVWAGTETQPDIGVGFRVGDYDFRAPEDALRATFEDPERPGLPVTLWLGNDLAHLVRQIDVLSPSPTPSVSVWRVGEIVFRCPLRAHGGLVSRDAQRIGIARLQLRGLLEFAGEGGNFRVEIAAGVEPEAVEAVRRVLRAARARAAAWCGVPLPRITVRLLGDVADFRLGGGGESLGRTNRVIPAADMLVVAGASDSVATDGVATDGGCAAIRAGLRSALGPAVVPWIEEGAGVSAANSWWGRDLDRWLARLVNAGSVPRVADLVDSRTDLRISTHVLGPARAALFDYLREVGGAERVRAIWCGTSAFDVDDELERAFALALRTRAQPFLEEVAERGRSRRAEVLAAPPSAGVVFAETGRDPREGYGSRGALTVLRNLRERGVRSIALNATFVDTGFGETWRVENGVQPTTGDTALFSAAFAARREGLQIALFPEVLTSGAGHHAGAWAAGSFEEWRDLFERQARVVEHAGLLASLCGIDWLCVGTGLRGATAEHDGRRAPTEERSWKRDGWRRVIGAARGAFSGGLTYSAADILEADGVEFWADLDAIGLEIPLRLEPDDPDPTIALERSLRDVFAGIGRCAVREDRPVLLTQVGFVTAAESTRADDTDRLATQLQRLNAAADAAMASAPFDVRAVWLARVGTDPADCGVNARDPILCGDRFTTLEPFLVGVERWLREGSRAAGRSPR